MASFRDRVPSVQSNAASQQQQPIVQHDGPADTKQKTVQTQSKAATVTGVLQIHLQNSTKSSTVYAYITGQAINNNNALFLLRADAKTPYYPPNPPSTGTKLGANVSIPLGAPGNTITATIPQLAGGRIWFSIGAPLVFAVNPGPGLVEPSIFNPQDPNINTSFGFAEFTFNSAQLFVNISYVDFVGPPIALTLTDTSNTTQHVSGMPANGMQAVASGLVAQTQKDGRRWSSLIVNTSTASNSGQLLRILSPNSGILLNPTWFQPYWTDYVNQVYARYTTSPLTVNTQASFGNVTGEVGSQGNLNFGAGGLFPKPTAADIFGCSTGPFATGQNAETNTIIPRLAAAFNRSTLLATNNIPDGEQVSQYYTNATTNHYARIVHSANLDGKGYAFPYDDVVPDGGVPQEGALFSYSPALLTVAVGGNGAHAA
ncbi:hypothetical protein B0A55_03514 [Friedmanniomyces simplex]|uniref:GH64 domain-containing protein n=1 Tax=Friedmanniomyces simplex TaxID=329884 RepID=A0A4U0XV77_9PEZI|nr:hypothetical protein B0A55_03514 [Friedmanniomyces simplex]